MARPRMTVKITGEPELIRKLKALSAAVAGQHLEAAAKIGAEVVREEASRRAPRRTGTLAGDIVAETTIQEGSRVEISVGPGKDAFYGLFLEVGTSKMAARPFLRPALDEKKGEVEAAVRDELKRRLGL